MHVNSVRYQFLLPGRYSFAVARARDALEAVPYRVALGNSEYPCVPQFDQIRHRVLRQTVDAAQRGWIDEREPESHVTAPSSLGLLNFYQEDLAWLQRLLAEDQGVGETDGAICHRAILAEHDILPVSRVEPRYYLPGLLGHRVDYFRRRFGPEYRYYELTLYGLVFARNFIETNDVPWEAVVGRSNTRQETAWNVDAPSARNVRLE